MLNKQPWFTWSLCLLTVLSFQLFSNVTNTAAVSPPKETCKTAACHATMGTETYVHGPVATGDCVFCHKLKQKHAFSRIENLEKLCSECHERPVRQKYVHVPFREGKCLTCHDPHQSPNKYQLRMAGTEICFKCHVRSKLKGRAHGSAVPGSCMTCHTAHQGDFPKLLLTKGGR